MSATGLDQQLDLGSRHQLERTDANDVFFRAHAWELPSQVRAMDLMPYFRELTRNEGPTCLIDGREAIMLGSNNYLGLTTDPRVREAALRALRDDGPSLTGSRLLNGTTTAHVEFERKLARFVGREDALVFTTGYQANVGLLTALISENATVVVDKLCHASIHDGARVARGRCVTFRHNDVEDLERVVAAERAEDRAVLVMVDGVYSMEGDIAPLPAIREVCDRYAARLAVDDAHALGTLGRTGRGSEEHFEMPGIADVLSGTFSKSLASIGGWVAGDAKVIDWIRFYGRPLVFSASLPPAQLAAASAALDILTEEPWRVERVQSNARYWKAELERLGFQVGKSATPVVPIVIGDDFRCLLFGKALLEAGVYVNPVLYPAVPRDGAMIRTSVMATHERSHLDRALEILDEVARRVGVPRTTTGA